MGKRKRRNKANQCHWCGRGVRKNMNKGEQQFRKGQKRDGLIRTRDHVNPKSLGGLKTVVCCLACNQIKGAMTERQWLQFRLSNPQWWKLFKG
jgi:hypothetical protein